MKRRIFVFLLLAVSSAAIADARRAKRRDEVVRAIERAAPAVVNISTDQIINRDFFSGWNLFGGPTVAHSLGSGGIFTADGYAFTNAHVVNQASRIVVTLQDGAQFPADLVNVDAARDLAVIKIKADRNLPTLVLGRSDDLLVGEKAIAVGNPFGLENSVTTGVVSAVNRDIEDQGRVLFKGVLQTDALINPGNSGGPLLNIFGEVIGVNSAIRAGAQGIGFAIPIDPVKESLSALLDYRKLRRIRMGFDVKSEYAGDGPEETIVVTGVVPGSPAAKAGLRGGDRVTAVAGRATPTVPNFMAAVLDVEGSAVPLTVSRDGRDVKLAVAPVATRKPDASKLALSMLGLSVQQMTSELAANVGVNIDHGILVSDVAKGSTAWKAGFKAGDVIRQVNRNYVRTMDEFGLALEEAEGSRSVILDVLRVRGPMTARYIVEVPVRPS